MTIEHLDIVIVGAGLSGICAAHHLAKRLPRKSLAILEGRDAIGGTWDLFRYPGVRSDSDMFTLGYSFRPWLGENAIADGPSILAYIRATAAESGLDSAIRLRHEVVRAAWSSKHANWTLDVRRAHGTATITCGFLFVCAGYYDYESGYLPELPGLSQFRGRCIHPQFWPDDVDCDGKRIVVIGSGATAMTLVPALSARGAKVTMLQRSPSYVVSLPAKDRFAQRMRRLLPERWAYQVVRWRNVLLSVVLYRYARRKPEQARHRIMKAIQRRLGPSYDVQTHFNPRYKPWDQRVCLVPDADLFKAIRSGRAEMITDEIETVTDSGVRLRSGRELEADIIVTATGLKLKLVGGIEILVDGARVDLATTTSYKGCMFGDLPNLAYALGYTNASWTLKCDLVGAWVGRLLSYMDRHGYATCAPKSDPTVVKSPIVGFTSGYVRRSIDSLPKQGDRKPWRLNQNYLLDTLDLKFGSIADGTLEFK